MMKFNTVGVAVTLVIAVGGIIFLGLELQRTQAERDLIAARECSGPTEKTPCLVLTFPQLKHQRLGGVTFDYGTCSKDSVGPRCEICGYDLSLTGRVELTRQMLRWEE